ncbi:MBL fold metallo-hydrolase [Candidatus Nomurabacteria bacterium]|nr:MBL fold metallo-hydrolase [Candidatus Nomurabacteria bacterium]
MHISWLGNTAIRLQAKSGSNDVNIVIDPYKPSKGSAPRSLTPQIALYTRGSDNSITLSGDPFVLETAGECETSGVLMYAAQGNEPGNNIVRIDSEGMSLGHLGMLSQEPNDAQMEILSGVDVLFIPVGGNGCYDAQKAVKIVNMIEPRVVIPMAYQCDNDPKAADVSAFLKELGMKTDAPEKKVIIKKKDLPQEDMLVFVLEKE